MRKVSKKTGFLGWHESDHRSCLKLDMHMFIMKEGLWFVLRLSELPFLFLETFQIALCNKKISTNKLLCITS